MYNELLDSVRLPLVTARDVMEYVGHDVPSASEILSGRLPNFVTYGHFQDSFASACDRMALRSVINGSSCYAKLDIGIFGIGKRTPEFYGEFVDATTAYILKRNGFSLARIKGVIDTCCLLSPKPGYLGIAQKINETYACILIDQLEDVLVDYLQ